MDWPQERVLLSAGGDRDWVSAGREAPQVPRAAQRSCGGDGRGRAPRPFARFAPGYAGAGLSARGCRLVVVDPAELGGDLVRDVTGMLASLCAWLCGRGSAADRVAGAVGALRGDAA